MYLTTINSSFYSSALQSSDYCEKGNIGTRKCDFRNTDGFIQVNSYYKFNCKIDWNNGVSV